MSQLQVKKVVAVCFLEAVKLTLDNLGAQRLELSTHGVQAPPDLTRIYTDVRRLRDYLQRCIGGYGEQVDLDIAPADVALLVACLRRYVTVIDTRLAADGVTPEDRETLLKKQQVLSHWTVELVTKPLLHLPQMRQVGPSSPGEGERSLRSRIQDKLYGDVQQRPKILPPSSGSVVLNGQRSFGDIVVGVDVTDVANLSGGQPADAAPAAAAAAASASAPAAPRPPRNPSVLLDHRKLTDPRLRALAGVDARSYARALAAGDYRMATVMMASVLESVLVDHVMTRRADFGVTSTPEAWNVPELLVQALGDEATARDKSLGATLFASRNLLRPAVQVSTPMVVTVAGFEALRDFVYRAVHTLGYGAPDDVQVTEDEEAPSAVEPPPSVNSLADYAAMVDPEE